MTKAGIFTKYFGGKFERHLDILDCGMMAGCVADILCNPNQSHLSVWHRSVYTVLMQGMQTLNYHK